MIYRKYIPKFLDKFLKRIIREYFSILINFRVPYRYIFVLSHMRGGTSLLTHILISNPEICGYGETHVRYKALTDVDFMSGKIFFMLRRFFIIGNERYLFDKILHSDLLDEHGMSVLCRRESFFIFLVREPCEAILGVMSHLNRSEKTAVNYYIDRMKMLEICGREIKEDRVGILITYEQLVNRTKEVFSLLEEKLELRVPLSEFYETLPTTGRSGIGDTSENIHKGMIIRERKKSSGHVIADENITLAINAYNQCINSLKKVCYTIDHASMVRS